MKTNQTPAPELKICPFCAMEVIELWHDEDYIIHPENVSCILDMMVFGKNDWNQRTTKEVGETVVRCHECGETYYHSDLAIHNCEDECLPPDNRFGIRNQ
mgnify:CR=1 FL=1